MPEIPDRDPIRVIHAIARSIEESERQALANAPAPFDYIWRVKTVLPERTGQRCRVISFPAANCAWVEFQDGFKTFAIRNHIKKVA
jgi:hypothetical protein